MRSDRCPVDAGAGPRVWHVLKRYHVVPVLGKIGKASSSHRNRAPSAFFWAPGNLLEETDRKQIIYCNHKREVGGWFTDNLSVHANGGTLVCQNW